MINFKKTLFLFALLLGFSSITESSVVTDENIATISEKLQDFDNQKLLERKLEIENRLLKINDTGDCDEDGEDNCDEVIALLSLELSIIEKLLAALAAYMISDMDTKDAPVDSVFPVITINGDNPATVELGSTYTDAGATSDGGETVTVSGTVDTNVLGTYTITYSASDAAGNTTTASRTVNVVDTTAPVITSPDTFSAQENQTSIGTVTATDLQAVTFSISGSELLITSSGVLTFAAAPDYESISLFTATVTATDSSRTLQHKI